MSTLQQTALDLPDVHTQFVKGLFTVHKSPRRFSAIAIDHAHEHDEVPVWPNTEKQTKLVQFSPTEIVF